VIAPFLKTIKYKVPLQRSFLFSTEKNILFISTKVKVYFKCYPIKLMSWSCITWAVTRLLAILSASLSATLDTDAECALSAMFFHKRLHKLIYEYITFCETLCLILARLCLGTEHMPYQVSLLPKSVWVGKLADVIWHQCEKCHLKIKTIYNVFI